MRKFFYSLTHRLLTDNISFLAGGVAFYGLLALFPAMGALVALMALAANPQVVQEELQAAQFLFPPDAFNLLHQQILLLVSQSGSTLSMTFFLGLFLAFYSANRGTKALLAALNRVFRVHETRRWWLRQAVALAITFGGLAFIVLALFIIIALPIAATYLPDIILKYSAQPLIWLRWAILAGAVFAGVLLLFAFGPSIDTHQQRLRHVVMGASVTSLSWVALAVVGSWAIKQLPQLHAAYGSISAVIVLMLWMLMSAYCLLLGAAVMAALGEHFAQPELELE